MNIFEQWIYFVIWCFSVIYALYCFTAHCVYYNRVFDTNDFSKGWLIDRNRDVSDIEWSSLRQTLIHNFIWILIHCLLTQLISRTCIRYLPVFFITFSSLVITVVLNWKCLIIIWFNILISLLIHSIGYQLLTYIMFVITLYLIHSEMFSSVKQLCALDNRQSFMFEVCMAWLNAKCLSASIDRIRQQKHCSFKFNELCKTVAYCLYLPAFYTGPLHQYQSFIDDLSKLPFDWTRNRVLIIIKQLLCYCFWALILELTLHFVYSTSIQYYPHVSESFNIWTLCGFGFALPLLFFIKYFVIYGSMTTIAQIDGIQLSPPPKCIARIHLCTYLWRHFDRGLHLWLTNYVYKPVIGTKWVTEKRILAAFVCFSCVCLWHGMDSAVITWSYLNFFGVSAEIIANQIDSTYFWKSIKKKLSDANNTRLTALIASPFFAIAFVSNIFFLSNWDVGYCFVKRILISFPFPLIYTLIVMYCGCHVSMYYRNKEQTNKL